MDIVLIVSVLIILTAPVLSRFFKDSQRIKSGLDGFVLVAVIGLITLNLLPEALQYGGIPSFLIAVTGFILPYLAEIIFHKSEEMTHRVIILISVLAVVVHAASDGAILAFAHSANSGSFIATGVLLHRMGEAITIWWLLRPIFSVRSGLAILAALAAMTIIGYYIVLFAQDWYNLPLVGYWQAFAAGSLFHIVMHPIAGHEHSHTGKPVTQAHRLGTALGVVFVFLLVGSYYLQHLHESATIIAETETMRLHHEMGYLGRAALIAAPLNLLFLITYLLYQRLRAKKTEDLYASLQRATPWTLVIWLAFTIKMALFPMYEFPIIGGGMVAFYLWLGIMCCILVHSGARNFFSVLMPSINTHKHNHSH
ncbi:ZIP family metal transporter [Kordiimonas pumila]|uniref:Uncharacterized protein n=1 Tax=Kordiimonas pumila TaxID=2161677 RepID=A0ABV7D5R7_9PROT|nr:hypothetical protein [Kordiimonas pumila]